MIELANGSIDYDECGEGPTVVLVPGSCSTGAAWRPVVSRLKHGFHCVTTSLLGYGGTAERRTAGGADISREAEVIEAVVCRAARPVHLVGHSFGGLVALAAALRNRVPLRSLAILDVPAVELLRSTGERQHVRAFQDMTDAYFRAFHAGETAAIETMIDFYGGAGTFASWPERVRSYAVETTAVNICDWATAYGFPLTPASLESIDVPTLIMWGGESHRAVRRANELLSRCIPRASAVIIPGAAHFMIATHPGEVADMIAQSVAGAEISARSIAETKGRRSPEESIAATLGNIGPVG